MRRILLVAVCSLAGFAPAMSAQTTPQVPSIVSQGLETLRTKGYEAALDLWTVGWDGPEDEGKREQLSTGFHRVQEIAGEVEGADIVKVVVISPNLTRVYAVLRYARQPVFFSIEAYRASTEWKIVSLKFNTTMGVVFPPSLTEP